MMLSVYPLKLLHLLCWVYWLGGDLGTFYSAGLVTHSALTPAQRSIAMRVMVATDLAPRVCMPLTLATGVNLAIAAGFLPLSTLVGTLVLLGCAAWVGMVLFQHHVKDRARVARVARVDFALRVVLCAGLGATAIAGLARLLPGLPPWLALKLLCFAAAIGCGMIIRIYIKPFGPAFARLMQSGPSAEDDRIIATSIGRCRPFVVLIWVLLLIAAATGIHWLTPS